MCACACTHTHTTQTEQFLSCYIFTMLIECGQQTKDNHVEPHIVHGNDAPIGQWPWQVALFINHTARWLFSCGGTLVSHHHIITAAHCVK